MSLLARGVCYFGEDGFPVTIKRVRTLPGGAPSHPHDVTEIEHCHDFCELVIVTGGRGLHVFEGESSPVCTGHVFVVRGDQAHCFRERDNLELANVMFDPARLPLPAGLLRRLPGYGALFMPEPAFCRLHRSGCSGLYLGRREMGPVEELVERIEAECMRPGPGREAALVGLLVSLMVCLSRHYAVCGTAEGAALLRVGELVCMLERRFREPWSLEQLARQARLSRTGLLRVFRKATGQSPIDFLIGLRIGEAKRLLRQTALDMTDIAFETGFGDSNYFARRFRRACG
ncbi:MAG: AraC family transcriptional regulator, partial [Opitutaceae bacterium]|nr:AraC family transcriptional regulator [Opitutaceae bacterium]